MARRTFHTNFSGNPKDLLNHVIRLAKNAGFSFRNFLDDYDSFVITSFNVETGRMVFVLRNEDELRVVYDSIYTLFFDLTFARALFGADWEIHLVNLARSKDRLMYIAENLQTPYINDKDDNQYQVQTA